jgi:hypothetical protein
VRNNSRGYNMIEMMMASALLVVVILGTLQLFADGLKPLVNSLKTQKAKTEVNLSLASIKRELFNAVLLNPEEPLLISTDSLYKGLAGLKSHPKCRFAVDSIDPSREQYSIFRATSVMRKIPPEELLKAWAFTDTINDLRISYHDSAEYMFQPATMDQVKEIAIIDIDGTYRSRFLVKSAKHMPAANIDPYTLLPDPDPTKVFAPWTQLVLEMPKNAAGTTLPPLAFNFISNSMVYPVKTKTYCMDKDQNKIIIYDESNDTVSDFFDGESYDVDIVRFEMRYLNTVKTQRVDKTVFISFPDSDIVKRRCINLFELSMELKKRNVEGTTATIRFGTSGLLHTFNEHRPANCEP